ncbi:MAG: DUF5110 domain-containing protein [Candidatus Adiutrix sp.]|jgi:alpha-glucosidase|nr:DUF5110 domain-containing protein [Candidatus Adiutrix sp.]
MRNPGLELTARPALAAFLLVLLLSVSPASAQNGRTVTRLGPWTLSMGLVSDEIWLFELSVNPVEEGRPFELSMMLSPELSLSAPSGGGDSWSSAALAVRLGRNPPSLTISRSDGARLWQISPYAPDGQLSGLAFSGDFTHLYGLGADYLRNGSSLSLLGENNRPANPFGNGRVGTFGGRPDQVQAPVLYGLGLGRHCAALMVDETLPLQWSLKGLPWTVGPAGPLGPDLSFRFLVISGEDLTALRQRLMLLLGRPSLPPLKALGVWASAVRGHGETDWREKLNNLKNNVPGLAGLLVEAGEDFGLRLDLAKFFNLRLMTDESASVPLDSGFYPEMASRSFLVRQQGPGGPLVVLSADDRPGGLVDFTNPAAASFWHSLLRAERVGAGLSSFRLTDGDLDGVSPAAWYDGGPGGRAHSHYAWANSYPLKWLEGLNASVRNQRLRSRLRLMLLTRSGLPGLARRSGFLYNGEGFLFGGRVQLAARANLALSGIDYYSSDLSGNLAARDVDEYGQVYDAWLARNALTDYPLILPEALLYRPAARYNLAVRESLRPYLYSLAWKASEQGDPLLAPLVYYFQDDLNARNQTGEMMLGGKLLLGLNFDGSAERAEVYVPPGRWYNWRSGEVIDRKEGGLVQLDLKDSGQLTPPILALGGAIIPGIEEVRLKDAGPEKAAALKIFIGGEASEFTWYEDDGETLAYLSKNFSLTNISAVSQSDGSTVVTIKAREGSWDGAPAERRFLLDIYGPKAPGEATLDKTPHNRVARVGELDQLDSGWASFGANRIRFKTPPLDLTVDHVLWFK